MSAHPVEKALLVALNQGLPPNAEPLVCDDLRGAHSLFGENMRMPRPVRKLRPERLPGMHSPVWADESRDPYSSACVLWESQDRLTPCETAREIAAGNSGRPGLCSCLSVPATVYIAGESTSTFSLAWTLLRDGNLPDWGAVISSCQKEGRGQLRRQWHSPRGNLHVSFRLPASPVFSGDGASLAVGYLLANAFRQLGFPVSLKWPNDLVLLEQYKIGGILLEEKDGVLLAGLGVNLAEAPPSSLLRRDAALRSTVLLPHHAELRQPGCHPGLFCGELWSEELPLAPFSLWKQLVTLVILEYSAFVQQLGMPYVLHCLNETDSPSGLGRCADAAAAMPGLLAWKGKKVVRSDDGEVSGRCIGVGPCGGLLLALSDGKEQEFFSGSFYLAK